MQDSLVSINIYDNDKKLINKNNVPILFYWNGETDIKNDISSNDNFLNYINDIIGDEPYKYLMYNIAYFYFKYDEVGEEIYQENDVKLQEIIELDKFDSIGIINYYLYNHFTTLYETAFKEKYNSSITNINDIIIDIYLKLKEKFSDRIIKTTIINWVRSELLDKDNFNTNNSNHIINILTNILSDNE